MTNKNTVASLAERLDALEGDQGPSPEARLAAIVTAPIDNTVQFEQSMNLHQRISGVRSRIKRMGHDKTIGEGNYAYEVTTHEAVREVLRPLMAEFGLVDYIRLTEMAEVDTGLKRGGNNSKRPLIMYKGQYDYRIINVDNPDDMLLIPNVRGTGEDAGDKGEGKSSTYALKAAQKILFLISTGDDGEEDRAGQNEQDTAPAEPVITPEQVDHIIYSADQYFGDDAKTTLKRMCEKGMAARNVTAVHNIPTDLYDAALRMLKNQAVREGRIDAGVPTSDDNVS